MSATENPRVLGVVLLGGRSRRMGRPKHLIAWDGETWLERIAHRVAAVSDGLCLCGAGIVPDRLAGVERLFDPPDVAGPLAGLAALREMHPDRHWLVAACDQPLVSEAVLRWMLAEWEEGLGALLPRLEPERVEPFPGIYGPGSHAALAALQAEPESRRSLQRLPGLARVKSPLVPVAWRGELRGANLPGDLDELSLQSSGPGTPRA